MSKIHNTNSSYSWTGAIKEAKLQLRMARGRVERLEKAIQILKERRRDGDPFPGEATPDVIGQAAD